MLNSIANGISGSLGSYVMELLYRMPAILVALAFHEWAHAYAAYKLGDPTAYNLGRMTLNPLAHIDLIGLIMMMLVRFGWAKPVPVNMWKFKNPKKGMAITAAAGPLSNIIIAVICLFIYGVLLGFGPRIGKVGSYFVEMLLITAYLSTALAIFNIIPIPPLDGSKVLYSFVSDRTYTKLMYYERYGMIILVVAVFLLSRTHLNPLGRAASWLMEQLFVAAQWGFDLAKLFV